MKLLAATLLLLFSTPGICQDYPNRPVRMLVGYPAGGGMDTIARILAPKLGDGLGQPFVVENRPGASGAVAAEAMLASPADGHVLMVAESGTLALPAVNPQVKLDPVKQLVPVGGVALLPMAFVVNPAFPARSTSELIATLKANPGKYSYASPGIGTMQHLAFESFKRAAAVDALHVPYKGANAMLPDLMSGQVPIAVVSSLAAMGPVKAGKLRAIAVTSPQRVPSVPDWPTMAETLPGFSAAPRIFVVAPPGTPAPAVQKLAAAIRAAVTSQEVAESFAKQGAEPAPAAPAELATQIADEVKRWAGVVRDAGIKAE
jgi:tripartite-type tricarboxylate transporter receptor subunit TctC